MMVLYKFKVIIIIFFKSMPRKTDVIKSGEVIEVKMMICPEQHGDECVTLVLLRPSVCVCMCVYFGVWERGAVSRGLPGEGDEFCTQRVKRSCESRGQPELDSEFSPNCGE